MHFLCNYMWNGQWTNIRYYMPFKCKRTSAEFVSTFGTSAELVYTFQPRKKLYKMSSKLDLGWTVNTLISCSHLTFLAPCGIRQYQATCTIYNLQIGRGSVSHVSYFLVIYTTKRFGYLNHILVTSVTFLLCVCHVKFKECLQFERV